MRARRQGEYDTDRGKLMGDHKDTMNSMFDTKHVKAQNMQSRLF